MALTLNQQVQEECEITVLVLFPDCCPM